MKSETRANYIFLGIFLLIMGPGLAMLTMKAYKRGGAAGMNPPAPRMVATYNNPTPQNPLVPRVVPPVTASFVETIARRVGNIAPYLQRHRLPDGMPHISQERTLECFAQGEHKGNRYLGLVGWDRNYAPLPTLYAFTATRGEQAVTPKLIGYEQLNLPLDVRAELQEYGYVKPPDGVVWMLLEIEGAGEVDAISLRYQIDEKRIADRLEFRSATNLPATRSAP